MGYLENSIGNTVFLNAISLKLLFPDCFHSKKIKSIIIIIIIVTIMFVLILIQNILSIQHESTWDLVNINGKLNYVMKQLYHYLAVKFDARDCHFIFYYQLSRLRHTCGELEFKSWGCWAIYPVPETHQQKVRISQAQNFSTWKDINNTSTLENAKITEGICILTVI